MKERDILKYFISGYNGIRDLEEYDLKEYILKDIENYINMYISKETRDNYEELEKEVEEFSKVQNLQDSLNVLKEIDAPMEVILLVKHKINRLKER